MTTIIDSKANLAFKLAVGKVHTSNLRDPCNEPESTQAISMGQFAWAEKIHPVNPSDASNAGIVTSLLTLNLVAVSGTDGTGVPTAYFCRLGAAVPAQLTGKINPRTGSAYAAFDRIGNIVPAMAGAAYRPKLYKGAVETTPLDASDWVIDCFAGVITQESDVPASMVDYGSTGTVQAYIYIGKTVSDAIAVVQAAATTVTFHDKKTVGRGITGAINGVNTTFVLDNVPDVDSEHFYYNGMLMNAGTTVDYTLTGKTIEFLSYVPIVGDSLIVSYRTTA